MNRRKVKVYLVMMQCIYVIFLLFWIFFALIAMMMFDAPGSEHNPRLVLLYVFIWLYPIGLIAGAIGGWGCYRRGTYKAAMWWNALPLVWLLPIAAVLVYANTR